MSNAYALGSQHREAAAAAGILVVESRRVLKTAMRAGDKLSQDKRFIFENTIN